MPQRDVNMNAAIPANTTITYGSTFGNKLDWQNDFYRTSYRRGYTFGGWYTNPQGTGTPITSSSTSTFTSDQTLYAKWIPVSMTVQYHRNGGQWASGHTPSPSNATYTVSYGSTYRDQMTGFDWTLPVRSGYVFMGWNTKQDGTGLFFGPDAHVGLTTNHHLYAYWVEEENLPPAITTCFEGTSQLCAPSNYSGYTWSPAAGLSSTTGKCVTLTSANMSSNNVTYTCTYAKGNVANFDFSQGNAGFSSDYEIVTDEADRNNELQPERAVSVTDCWHHVHGSLDPDCSLTSYEDGAAGKFLAVNGGAVANAVVYEQTIAVTRNTNYRLSAMYANAAGTGDITSATARLMFFVNGVRASAETDTAFANEHAWKEMYTTWNSGSNDFATIQIRDFATATQGNDFALDHILFEATTGTQSGTYTVTVTRRQQLNPGATLPETETITRGQTFSKTVTPSTPTGGDGQYKYQWYVNGTAISGATGASLAIPTDPYTNVPGTYEFKRFVYDESDCGQVYSTGSYTLTVLNNLSLTLDCPTASGNCYSFPNATFEGYATHVTVSFSDIPADGSSLNLPSYVTTANGFERVDITPYSKKIVLPEGYTSAQIQQLIRDITFCIPAGTHSSVRIGADMAASESDIYYFSGNDHYYKYVPYTTADVGHETWVSSYEKAKNSTLYGRKGYLATPTTYEEDIFLTKVSQSVAWLGATRLPNTGVDPNNDQYYLGFNTSETAQTVAGGNQTWYWACGPEKGQMLVDRATACQSFHDHNSPSLDNLYDYFYNNLHIYSNWNGHGQGEPNGGNNFTGDPSIECQYDNTHVESCLTILQVGGDASNDYYTGRGHLRNADTTHFSWNDIGYDKIGSSSSYTARGYIIEYGDQTFSNSTDDVFDANEMVQAIGNIGTFELTAETPICSGSTSTLTATPTFGPYKWYEGSTATGTPVQSGSSNTYTTAALTADATYTVVANDDQCAQTRTVTVVVTPNLTAPITITYDTNICKGDDVIFTATGGTGSDDEIFWSETGCPEATFFEDFKTMNYGVTTTTASVNADGNLVATSTSGDAMIHMGDDINLGPRIGSFDPNTYKYFQIRYKVTAGNPELGAEIFFTNARRTQADADQRVSGDLISDGEWHILTIDASSHQYWTNSNITGWRFDYCRNDGVTMEIDYIALTNAPHVGSTYTMTAPASGTHTVYADRLGGCHSGSCKTETINVPNKLVVNPGSMYPVKCKGQSNGTFYFSVHYGTEPYTVTVSKGAETYHAILGVNNPTYKIYYVQNLAAGTYTYTVTDAHGCSVTKESEVTEPADVLTANAALVNPDSCQGNKGKAMVTPAGGNDGYEFLWSDGQTSQTATGLSSVTNSGAYTVTVTDAKGCTANASVTVPLYNPLAMNDITGPTICAGNETGNEFFIVPVNGTNGTIPDGTNYTWDEPTVNGSTVPSCITGAGLAAQTTPQSSIHGVLKSNCSESVTLDYEVTPINGICEGNASHATVTVTTTVNPGVEVDMPNDTTICSNAPLLNIDATFLHSLTNYTTVWTLVDGNGNKTTVATHNHTHSAAGDTCRLTLDPSTFNCSGQYTYRVAYAGVDAQDCEASDGCVVTVDAGTWGLPDNGEETVECISAATPLALDLTASPVVLDTRFPTVTDGCGRTLNPVFVGKELQPTSFTCNGKIVYTYKYTACDNTEKTWTYTYNIEDKTKPVVNVTGFSGQIAANIDKTKCEFTIPDLRDTVRKMSNDNCIATNHLTISQSVDAGTKITAATQVSVHVIDSCGNDSTIVITVTVPTRPTIATLTSTPATCNGHSNGTATVTVSTGTGTAPYAYHWNNNQSLATASNLAAGQYYVTVTDANGCTVESEAVTVSEPDALTISDCLSSITRNTDAGKNYATVSLTMPSFSPADNNARLEITYSPSTPTGATATNANGQYPIGTTTVTIVAKNDCPEEVSCTPFTVTVTDNEKPVITSCGATGDQTVTPNDGPNNYIHNNSNWNAKATDNSGAVSSLTYTLEYQTDPTQTIAVVAPDTTLNGQNFPYGVTKVTWTAKDAAGNEQTCTFNVEVIDNTAPEITCASTTNQTVVPNTTGNIYTFVGTENWGATATDNVGVDSIYYTLSGATVSATHNTSMTGQQFSYGTTTVTWTATDKAGNKAPCSFNVVVEDVTPPVITCAVTGNKAKDNDAGEGYHTHHESEEVWNASATDNSGTVASLYYKVMGKTTTVDGSNTTLDGQKFNIGTTTVRWYATDPVGNIDSCEFTVTVSDTTKPCIENCDPIPNPGPTCSTIGSPTKYSDLNKNYYTHSGNDWDVKGADNSGVDPTMTWTMTHQNGTTVSGGTSSTLAGVQFLIGKTTVTWTATDEAGLTATCSFVVTVLDTTKPCIGCGSGGVSCSTIGNQNKYNDAGHPYYTHSGTAWDVTATDNSGVVHLTWKLTNPDGTVTDGGTSSTLDGAQFKLGKTTVEWTATDPSGNHAECTFDVTVKATADEVDLQCPTGTAVEKDYDGQPLHPEASASSLIETGVTFVISYSIDGGATWSTTAPSITNAGSRTVRVKAHNDNYDDATCTYTLKINKKKLKISGDLSKTYDGTPFTVYYNDPGLTYEGMVPGESFTSGTITTDGYMVGDYYCRDNQFLRSMADLFAYNSGFGDTSVTKNYSPEFEVVLRITKREIELTAKSAEKIYDGTSLTVSDLPVPGYDITSGRLADADVVKDTITSVDLAGWILCVGDSASKVSNAVIKHGDDVVTDSYTITYVNGHLVVKPVSTPLTCPANLDITMWYGRCDTMVTLPESATLTPPVDNTTIVNDLAQQNPLPAGTHTITWNLLDACGNVMRSCPQTVTVQYPPCGRPEDTVRYDGFTYHTVRVGCECWLQENLRNTHYADGTDVPGSMVYGDDPANEEDYGRLYTWYSSVKVPEGDNTAVPADSVAPTGDTYVKGICPDGWALPTLSQYDDLWLNGYGTNGVKDKDTRYWLPGYAGTDPNSHFNARGAGYYDPATGRYYNLLGDTYFWTSDENPDMYSGYCAVITHICPELMSQKQLKGRGQSVRCVQVR